MVIKRNTPRIQKPHLHRCLVMDSQSKELNSILLLASYIVNPATTYTDVASIAREFGYTEVQQDETVYGKGAKKQCLLKKSLPNMQVEKHKQFGNYDQLSKRS